MSEKQLPARIVKTGQVASPWHFDLRINLTADATILAETSGRLRRMLDAMKPRPRQVVFPFERDLDNGAIDGECTVEPLQERNDNDETDSLPALRF